jgi:hypothetical protein
MLNNKFCKGLESTGWPCDNREGVLMLGGGEDGIIIFNVLPLKGGEGWQPLPATRLLLSIPE